MRILQIVPGSGGGFYCQNCQRDLDLVTALRRQGHDVTLMPLYLPLAASLPPDLSGPVFFGAIGLYLRHRLPRLGRRLPQACWRWLDAPALLRWAARRSASTAAGGLGDLTLSMLRGAEGGQRRELEQLIAWLNDNPAVRPEAIVLSNALLLGLARPLRAATGAPVLCWLQDEHVWMDAMTAAESEAVWRELRARAADADVFLSVSNHYAGRLAPRLGLQPSQVRVIPMGVEPSRYRPADPARQPPTIGYLARLTPEEGFDTFVEAFIRLHADPRWRTVRMAATGGAPPAASFLRAQRRKLARAGLTPLADIDPLRFQGEGRFAFLASLAILSVPAPQGDAGCAYVSEALAAGVAVAQPRVGAAPEILESAGCGVVYEPHTAAGLAAAWSSLLADPARLAAESRLGRQAAAERFDLAQTARQLALAAAAAGATTKK